MDEKQKLIEMIKKYSEGKTTIKKFWEEYHIFYSSLDSTLLKEYDSEFFDEVNEKLYYTDWQSPADSALLEEKGLLAWIQKNLPLFLNGKWKSEWSSKK